MAHDKNDCQMDHQTGEISGENSKGEGATYISIIGVLPLHFEWSVM